MFGPGPFVPLGYYADNVRFEFPKLTAEEVASLGRLDYTACHAADVLLDQRCERGIEACIIRATVELRRILPSNNLAGNAPEGCVAGDAYAPQTGDEKLIGHQPGPQIDFGRDIGGLGHGATLPHPEGGAQPDIIVQTDEGWRGPISAFLAAQDPQLLQAWPNLERDLRAGQRVQIDFDWVEPTGEAA